MDERTLTSWCGLLILLGLGVLAGSGCQDSEKTKGGSSPPVKGLPNRSSTHQRTNHDSPLGALAISHRELAARLSVHEVKSKATLVTRIEGKAERRLEQNVRLRYDGHGHFAAEKITHPQYGQEVIWNGEWLFSRLRYSSFLKRKARPGEPATIADRMYGVLPAYLRLLGRFMKISRQGMTDFHGRPGIKLTFALMAEPRLLPEKLPPAKTWRKTMAVKTLTGSAVLDKKTNVPLFVMLNARWSFRPPLSAPFPDAGIPTQIHPKRLGQMELAFRQELTAPKKMADIEPPPAEETVANPRRHRLEIERQILVGELPLSALDD